MIFTKSSNKVISLLLAIALVLTMFVTVAPTNVLATGASGEVGESGINLENLQTGFAETSPYATKKPYEFFIVGEALPNITTADFAVLGEGSENVTITGVEFQVCDETTGAWATATSPVEAGKWYRVSASYEANDGYQLYYGEYDDVTASINFDAYACVNSSNEIVAIEGGDFWHRNSNLPTYKAGQTIPTSISNAGNKACWIANDKFYPFTISDTILKVMILSEVLEDGVRVWDYTGDKTFVAGETYGLACVLQPKDGYTFNDEEINSGFAYWFDGFVGKVFVKVFSLDVCPEATNNVANGQIQGSVDVSAVIDVDNFEGASDDDKQTIQNAINNGTAKIELSVDDITLTVPAEDKTAVESIKGEKQIKKYFDIDLNLVIGNWTPSVTELAQPITISLTVDRNLTGVEVIRVHNGVAETLPTTYNPVTGVLTFETDKFSTYALAYKDTTPTTTPVYGGGVAIIGTAGHIHNYKYSYDKDGHWQNCSCGAATSEQKHSLNSSGVCVCGYDENSKTNTPVANPSTGASSLTFIFVVLSVLALYGTTAIYSSRKKI